MGVSASNTFFWPPNKENTQCRRFWRPLLANFSEENFPRGEKFRFFYGTPIRVAPTCVQNLDTKNMSIFFFGGFWIFHV